MKAGFIGTGNMGSILVEAFLTAETFNPSDITVSNRTEEKANRLAKAFPGLKIAQQNQELVENVDIIFICVKPHQFKDLFSEINSFIKPEQILISITSPIQIKDLESWVSCKIAKVIPSITNQVLAGNTLYTLNDAFSTQERTQFIEMLESISQPIEIEENQARICSDLSSCGPAFLAKIIEQMITVASEKREVSKDVATQITTQMLYGLSELLLLGDYDLETVQQCVAVPGGVTEEGLNMLEDELMPIFEKLFDKTHEKHESDLIQLKDFQSQKA
ncbi:late competence protein ComER [Hazenella sp. IB182357]|uniref:Pyrroline-5-carboxylate reductase n=1 Tax=Polycladospora coralii TaxID=2771432 RepID=A0A926NCK7_9BACL|nr:late competence protein ComER [Polycladospora coralii]MBD1371109.1 late competence protein ComER [Polycladospora coralii]MBS7530051.1 late competence protein ComER [Polycladospora coralii]